MLLELLSWRPGAGVCGAQAELLFSPRSPVPRLSLWDRVLENAGDSPPPAPRCTGCLSRRCTHSLPWLEDATPGPHPSQQGGWGKVGTIRLCTAGLGLALRTRHDIKSCHGDGKCHEDGDEAEAAVGH